jgi:hypothetical protein
MRLLTGVVHQAGVGTDRTASAAVLRSGGDVTAVLARPVGGRWLKAGANSGVEPEPPATSSDRGDAAHRQSPLPDTIQPLEFTQKARDRSYRGVGQHMRVPMRIADGRHWHARCFSNWTSQQSSEIWRHGKTEDEQMRSS